MPIILKSYSQSRQDIGINVLVDVTIVISFFELIPEILVVSEDNTGTLLGEFKTIDLPKHDANQYNVKVKLPAGNICFVRFDEKWRNTLGQLEDYRYSNGAYGYTVQFAITVKVETTEDSPDQRPSVPSIRSIIPYSKTLRSNNRIKVIWDDNGSGVNRFNIRIRLKNHPPFYESQYEVNISSSSDCSTLIETEPNSSYMVKIQACRKQVFSRSICSRWSPEYEIETIRNLSSWRQFLIDSHLERGTSLRSLRRELSLRKLLGC